MAGGRISGEAPWRRSRIVVPVASPSAGSDWSFTVPAGHLYHPISVQWSLVTSSAVATRHSEFRVNDGVRDFLKVVPPSTQVASLTVHYAWGPDLDAVATADGQSTAIPALWLPAGWTIGSQTDAIDVADQYGGIFLYVIDTTVTSGDIDIAELPELVIAMAPGGMPA